MTITLYKVTADNRKLDKTTGLTPVATSITIEPTSTIDALNPVFVIANNSSYYSCNYLTCDTMGRSYYISSFSVDTAGRLNLHCTVDVLDSFKSDIKNCVATVIRSESIGKPTKYNDEKLPVNPVEKNIISIEMSELSGSFSSNGEKSYLLTVVGGDYTPAE